MPKIVTSIQGGTNSPGSPVHSDNPKEVGYVTEGSDGQENGRVPMKITSHMTGNNSEGIEGGIDHKGIDKGGVKTDFHR
jgi:hypothetical protein